jgi:hypothetical protein
MGGWDEWLIISLTSQGIVSFPYQNRPFLLSFHMPAAAGLGSGLGSFWVTQVLYLGGTGVATFLLVRRLKGSDDRLALLAGILAATWAPMDWLRLDLVLTVGYAGVTFVTVLSLLMLVESWRSRSWLGLILSATLALGVLRVVEAPAGLLAAGPALLWATEGPRAARRTWAAVFLGFVAVGLVLAAKPLLPGGAATYQVENLGLSPEPLGVGRRLLQQAVFHVGPAFTGFSKEAASANALLQTLMFGLLWVGWWRRTEERPLPALTALKLGGIGLAGAVAGWSVQVLSGAMTTPARTQFLSAPGVGLLLAVAVALAWRVSPQRGRVAVGGVLGAWLIAVGAGSTATLQNEWDKASRWPVQSQALRDLTSLAPDFLPGTVVVALDDAGVWPASFTFRHAVQYLYEGKAMGWVPGGDPFLYPARLTRVGLLEEPWPAIRDAWEARPRIYPWESLVVVRVGAGGRLHLERTWPADLEPRPPAASRYAPLKRMGVAVRLPPERTILWER